MWFQESSCKLILRLPRNALFHYVTVQVHTSLRHCLQRCCRASHMGLCARATAALSACRALLKLTCVYTEEEYWSGVAEKVLVLHDVFTSECAARLRALKKPPAALPRFGMNTQRNVLFSHSSPCDFRLFCLAPSPLSRRLMTIISKETYGG